MKQNMDPFKARRSGESKGNEEQTNPDRLVRQILVVERIAQGTDVATPK